MVNRWRKRSRARSARARARDRVGQGGHDRRRQPHRVGRRDQDGGVAVGDRVLQGRQVAGHHRRLQGHGLDEDIAKALPARGDHHRVGGAQQVGDVVAGAEEGHRPLEPEPPHGGPQQRGLVAVAAGHHQPHPPGPAEHPWQCLEQRVQALLVLLAGHRDQQRGLLGDAEGGPDPGPALGVAASQALRVAAPRDHLEPVAGDVQPLGHHVGHVAGVGVEPDHPPGGGRVHQVGALDLPAAQPRGVVVVGTVGHIDQAGYDRDPGQAGADAAGHVGLEQGGVDQVGPLGGDQPLGPPGRPGAPAVTVQGEQPRPGSLQVSVDAGTVDEEGDVELNTSANVCRSHRGKRPLCPPRPKTVDQVEDADAAPNGTGCLVHGCSVPGQKCTPMPRAQYPAPATDVGRRNPDTY
jgi:hypothetical protein